MQKSTFPSHFCCRCISRCATRGTPRTRCSQDPSGILGTLAEPTGTDGFRLLCHQFYTSSLRRLGNCISRCNTFWQKMNYFREATLLLSCIDDQGRNTRNTVFLLPTGRPWCSVW